MRQLNKLLKYCSEIFTREENRGIVALSGLSVLSAVLEILTVGGIVPFINLFIQGEAGLDGRLLDFLRTLGGFFGSGNLILFIGTALIAVSLLKIGLNLYLVYAQARLATGIQTRLASRLLSDYAMHDYQFHVSSNSAALVKNVTVETANTYFFVGSLIKLIMNAIMVLAMLGFLLYVDYKITLGIAIFFTGLMLASVNAVSPKAKALGYEREDITRTTHKLSYQILRGIKEIKVSKTEDFFISAFTAVMNRLVPVGASFVTLSSAPRFVLEMLVYAGGIGLLMTVSHLWGSDKAFLGLFVAFLAAIYKLAPAFSAISSSAIEIRYAIPSLEIISAAIRTAAAITPSPALQKVDTIRDIRLEAAGFSYGSTDILKNVTLEIKKGEKIAVLGKTGTGKSTFNNLLTGLLAPTSGKVLADGRSLSDIDPFSLARIIGYLPQDFMILDDSIRANVAFGLTCAAGDEERMREILNAVHLGRFAENLGQPVGEDGSMLSGGERQRLAIARLLYKRPELVILDEITSALDERTEDAILSEILEVFKEKTVIMVTHSLRIVEKFDGVYTIENKSISKGEKTSQPG